MKNILFFLLLVFSSSMSGQCENPILKTISYTNGAEVKTKYCGTLNDRGQRDGYGRLEFINYNLLYKEGEIGRAHV